jgi:hypothetical protein
MPGRLLKRQIERRSVLTASHSQACMKCNASRGYSPSEAGELEHSCRRGALDKKDVYNGENPRLDCVAFGHLAWPHCLGGGEAAMLLNLYQAR